MVDAHTRWVCENVVIVRKDDEGRHAHTMDARERTTNARSAVISRRYRGTTGIRGLRGQLTRKDDFTSRRALVVRVQVRHRVEIARRETRDEPRPPIVRIISKVRLLLCVDELRVGDTRRWRWEDALGLLVATASLKGGCVKLSPPSRSNPDPPASASTLLATLARINPTIPNSCRIHLFGSTPASL